MDEETKRLMKEHEADEDIAEKAQELIDGQSSCAHGGKVARKKVSTTF